MLLGSALLLVELERRLDLRSVVKRRTAASREEHQLQLLRYLLLLSAQFNNLLVSRAHFPLIVDLLDLVLVALIILLRIIIEVR